MKARPGMIRLKERPAMRDRRDTYEKALRIARAVYGLSGYGSVDRESGPWYVAKRGVPVVGPFGMGFKGMQRAGVAREERVQEYAAELLEQWRAERA